MGIDANIGITEMSALVRTQKRNECTDGTTIQEGAFFVKRFLDVANRSGSRIEAARFDGLASTDGTANSRPFGLTSLSRLNVSPPWYFGVC